METYFCFFVSWKIVS